MKSRRTTVHLDRRPFEEVLTPGSGVDTTPDGLRGIIGKHGMDPDTAPLPDRTCQ